MSEHFWPIVGSNAERAKAPCCGNSTSHGSKTYSLQREAGSRISNSICALQVDPNMRLGEATGTHAPQNGAYKIRMEL